MTLGELRKAFEQHCVSAAQIALELGVPPTDDDLYISWRDVVEAVRGMGLVLDDEQINSMAGIRGSSGGRRRRESRELPACSRWMAKKFKASNSEVIEIHDLMPSSVGWHETFSRDATRWQRETFAASCFSVWVPSCCAKGGECAALELAQDETDSEEPMRQVRLQAGASVCRGSGQGASVAHPLSAELLERAAIVAAVRRRAVVAIKMSTTGPSAVAMPKRTRRGLSTAGQLRNRSGGQ